MILGIDPGATTGVATYQDGKLVKLESCEPLNVITIIEQDRKWLQMVVIEDSTLDSFIFTAPGVSHRAALKVARNIGEVDAYCKMLRKVTAEAGVAVRSISPKDKGAKINAALFAQITGWTAKSNQHERDAAMVAWRFRSMK